MDTPPHCCIEKTQLASLLRKEVVRNSVGHWFTRLRPKSTSNVPAGCLKSVCVCMQVKCIYTCVSFCAFSQLPLGQNLGACVLFSFFPFFKECQNVWKAIPKEWQGNGWGPWGAISQVLEQGRLWVVANVYLKPLFWDVNSLCGLVQLQPRRSWRLWDGGVACHFCPRRLAVIRPDCWCRQQLLEEKSVEAAGAGGRFLLVAQLNCGRLHDEN